MSQTRKGYSMKEKLAILHFINERNAHFDVKGRAMWMECALTLGLKRTWQSLKEVFLKRIFPDLHNSYYRLTDKQISLFRKGFQSQQSNGKEFSKLNLRSSRTSFPTSGQSKSSDSCKQSSELFGSDSASDTLRELNPGTNLRSTHSEPSITHKVCQNSGEITHESSDEGRKGENSDLPRPSEIVGYSSTPVKTAQSSPSKSHYLQSPEKSLVCEDAESIQNEEISNRDDKINFQSLVIAPNLKNSILLLSSSDDSVDKLNPIQDKKQINHDLFGFQNGEKKVQKKSFPRENGDSKRKDCSIDFPDSNFRISPGPSTKKIKIHPVYLSNSSSDSSLLSNSDNSSDSDCSRHRYGSRRSLENHFGHLPKHGLLNGELVSLYYKKPLRKRHSSCRRRYHRSSRTPSYERERKLKMASKSQKYGTVLSKENQWLFSRDLRRYYDNHRIGPKPKIYNYCTETPPETKPQQKTTNPALDFPNKTIMQRYYEDLERYYDGGQIGQKPLKQNYQRILTVAEKKSRIPVVNYIDDEISELVPTVAATKSLVDTKINGETFWKMKYLLEKNRRFEDNDDILSVKQDSGSTAKSISSDKCVQVSENIIEVNSMKTDKPTIVSPKKQESKSNVNNVSSEKRIQVSENISKDPKTTCKPVLKNISIDLTTESEDKDVLASKKINAETTSFAKTNKIEIAITRRGENPVNGFGLIDTQCAESFLEILQTFQKDNNPKTALENKSTLKKSNVPTNTLKSEKHSKMECKKIESDNLSEKSDNLPEKEKLIFKAISAEKYDENAEISTQRNIFNSQECKRLLGKDVDLKEKDSRAEKSTSLEKPTEPMLGTTREIPKAKKMMLERKILPDRALKRKFNLSPEKQPKEKNMPALKKSKLEIDTSSMSDHRSLRSSSVKKDNPNKISPKPSPRPSTSEKPENTLKSILIESNSESEIIDILGVPAESSPNISVSDIDENTKFKLNPMYKEIVENVNKKVKILKKKRGRPPKRSSSSENEVQNKLIYVKIKRPSKLKLMGEGNASKLSDAQEPTSTLDNIINKKTEISPNPACIETETSLLHKPIFESNTINFLKKCFEEGKTLATLNNTFLETENKDKHNGKHPVPLLQRNLKIVKSTHQNGSMQIYDTDKDISFNNTFDLPLSENIDTSQVNSSLTQRDDKNNSTSKSCSELQILLQNDESVKDPAFQTEPENSQKNDASPEPALSSLLTGFHTEEHHCQQLLGETPTSELSQPSASKHLNDEEPADNNTEEIAVITNLDYIKSLETLDKKIDDDLDDSPIEGSLSLNDIMTSDPWADLMTEETD